MTTHYYKSESQIRPKTIDFESSPTTVYIRKNIEELTRTDPETRQANTIYQYDEATISKTDYISVLHTKQEESDAALQELILTFFGGD